MAKFLFNDVAALWLQVLLKVDSLQNIFQNVFCQNTSRKIANYGGKISCKTCNNKKLVRNDKK